MPYVLYWCILSTGKAILSTNPVCCNESIEKPARSAKIIEVVMRRGREEEEEVVSFFFFIIN